MAAIQIAVLGAGVMGSAFAVTAAERGHRVLLIGSKMDEDSIAEMSRTRQHKPLGVELSSSIEPILDRKLSFERLQNSDLFVLGVNSEGVDWALSLLSRLASPRPLLVLTKGLVCEQGRVQTLPESLEKKFEHWSQVSIIEIGGACIALDLAARCPTYVIYAGKPEPCAWAQQHLATDYYHIATTTDSRGVALCAAIKNFLAIGIEALYVQAKRAIPKREGASTANNALAAATTQGVREMVELIVALGGRCETVWGRAGLGDLCVTIGNGRNARLGACLGRGQTLGQALAGEMKGQTVEGVGVARVLHECFFSPQGANLAALLPKLPLTKALLETIGDESGTPFAPSLASFA